MTKGAVSKKRLGTSDLRHQFVGPISHKILLNRNIHKMLTLIFNNVLYNYLLNTFIIYNFFTIHF